jgi:hypothetical protein
MSSSSPDFKMPLLGLISKIYSYFKCSVSRNHLRGSLLGFIKLNEEWEDTL